MSNLLELYIKLVGLVLLGVILGHKLPRESPTQLGKFLFWVGIPISIVSFLRQTDLSAQIWIAPAIAHIAILLGAFLAWLGIKSQTYWRNSLPEPSTQGTLILTAMVGNTGYLGFPITLAIVGQEYFGWALFYDLLGSVLGAYGFGVLLANRFGKTAENYGEIAKTIFINPPLLSFGFGLFFRQVSLPHLLETSLEKLAWSFIALALILIGIRLSKLQSWQKFTQAGTSIFIKMLLVPLVLGSTLPFLGITGKAAQVIVLQMAMPPGFATLIIAESFDLDRDLAVSAVSMGSILLLFTLPLWLWLF